MAAYLNNKTNKVACRHFPIAEVRQPLLDIGKLVDANSFRCSTPVVCRKYKPPIFEISQDELCDKENVLHFKNENVSISLDVQRTETDVTFSPSEVNNENGIASKERKDVLSFEKELFVVPGFCIPEYVAQLYDYADKGCNGSPVLWNDSSCDSQDSFKLAMAARKNLYNYADYSKDVYDYLREKEARYQLQPSYMTIQDDINFGMRRILVDWLVDVAEEYGLESETLYLTVSLIDRFLSSATVIRDDFQLVGAACMFIASKYEETHPLPVKEFVYLTEGTCSKSRILQMEYLVMTSLDFRINAPSIHYFLRYICCTTDVPNDVLFLARYLCELTLREVESFLGFMPSQIAAAAVSLSSYTSGYESWNVELEQMTGYKLHNLRNVIELLYVTYRRAFRNHRHAITKKYKSNKYNGVSSIPPPDRLLDF